MTCLLLTIHPFNTSTFHLFNFIAPSPTSGTLPRSGREFVEPLTPHSSPFTRRKADIRIIRDVGKTWFSDTLRAGFAFAHAAPYRKSAFTLAEVLITLGIIGVVAAMTLPALVKKYQDKNNEGTLNKSCF